jgi:hypothetical protein
VALDILRAESVGPDLSTLKMGGPLGGQVV